MMQLSVSLGVAMAAALLAAFTEGRLHQATVIDAFHSTYICIGLIGMVAASIFFQLDRNSKIGEPKSPVADET